MRTLYQHNVKAPPPEPNYRGLYVLKRAIENAKLTGKRNKITKGPRGWRGLSIFTLTLEEGPTCPQDCPMMKLRDKGKKFLCYGSNMPFAVRYQHGAALETALDRDLAFLHRKYPQGFVVRLHVLGDFYSVAYVRFWIHMLHKYSTLRIYGYTHRTSNDPIGAEIDRMAAFFKRRVAIRRSHGEMGPLPLTTTIQEARETPDGFILCLYQVNGTPCTECGLCFNGVTNVAFLEH